MNVNESKRFIYIAKHVISWDKLWIRDGYFTRKSDFKELFATQTRVAKLQSQDVIPSMDTSWSFYGLKSLRNFKTFQSFPVTFRKIFLKCFVRIHDKESRAARRQQGCWKQAWAYRSVTWVEVKLYALNQMKRLNVSLLNLSWNLPRFLKSSASFH